MTNRTTEEIARGLTEAQKAFLLSLPADGSWRNTTAGELGRHGPNALRGFGKLGLTEGYYHEVMRHRLTPWGIAVRSHLESHKP